MAWYRQQQLFPGEELHLRGQCRWWPFTPTTLQEQAQPTAADSNVGFHAEVLEANLHLG